MSNNPVKDKLARGEVVYGVWMDVFDASLYEMCGLIGFEYCVIDAEHSALDHRSGAELILACEAGGMVPIVRVPELNHSAISRWLDLGAMGIYVPHVNTGQEAEEIVSATKFGPMGTRAAGAKRHLKYGVEGRLADLCHEANESTMVIALIEDIAGIPNLDAIIGTEGVDVVGIGSGDLAFSMGYTADKSHPDVQLIVDDAEARIAASPKTLDAVVRTPEEAREAIARGCTMISVDILGMVREGSTAFLREMKQPGR